jgi:hypothetical protein
MYAIILCSYRTFLFIKEAGLIADISNTRFTFENISLSSICRPWLSRGCNLLPIYLYYEGERETLRAVKCPLHYPKIINVAYLNTFLNIFLFLSSSSSSSSLSGYFVLQCVNTVVMFALV